MAETAEIGLKRLAGINVLLMGPAGTGKTHSIGTLVDAGIETFYLGLESGLESLSGYYTDVGKPVPANLHWHMLRQPTAGFTEMLASANQISANTLEGLAKYSDPNRRSYNGFINLLTALSDFPDDSSGLKFGPVDKWGPDRALVIDGMTGIGQAAMSLVVGGKPVRNQADWQIAQDQVEKITRKLCDNSPCHFILLAHVEREVDQILGGVKLTVQTLGNKLAPKLPPMFSDVILAVRQGDSWTWDTGSSQADVKARNMPFKAGQPPSFAPLINRWRKRSLMSATPTATN
jgi:hypothetical protein